MGDRPDSRDWMLDRLLTVSGENEKKVVWLIGAFLILAFIAISINLGAIAGADLNLLFLKSTITDTWPIRLLLAIGVTMTFLAIVHFFFEMAKTIAALSYLAQRDHDRARELAEYGGWLVQNAPALAVNQGRVVGAIQVFALLTLVLVWFSFVYSLFV